MVKYKYTIRCVQRTTKLKNTNDQEKLPAGHKGIGSHMDYHFVATTDRGALALFHEHIPIGCSSDFVIAIRKKKPLFHSSGCVSIW